MSSHSSTKYRSTESDSHGSTRPSDNSERRPKRAPADDSTTQMRQRGVDPVTIANPHSNEIVNYDKGDMRTPAPISSDSTSTFTRDAGDGRGAAPIRSRDVRYQDDRDRGAIRSTTTDRDKPLPHSKDQERVPASRSHTDRANSMRRSLSA
ncbi:hypothetical protein FA15DRAFT_511358 [Coprinopsis marcescibilis]|uniref:Uncharacterized protein n=1 Tax=Coprinopsis marcescibilis TaxID=230819 RepID=A0A5C3KR41_COPMA|nr:hypothetical protein FA15DRAFT_511358 [Coprinopsis marcescibilis]